MYLLSYHIAYAFTRNLWFSTCVGLIMVFYYAAWFYGGGPPGSFVKRLVMFPLRVLALPIIDYAYINSNFRFVSTSVSGCVVMALMLALVTVQQHFTWRWFCICAMLAIAVSFNYLPATAFCYLLLATFFLYHL